MRDSIHPNIIRTSYAFGNQSDKNNCPKGYPGRLCYEWELINGKRTN